MRILHVTDCYLPRIGGIEVQVHGLAREQTRAGHRAEVWTTTPVTPVTPATPATDTTAGGAPATCVPVRRLGGLAGLLPSPSALTGLGRELRAARPDIVHVHASVVSPFAWVAARTAGAAGIPTIVTMHSLLRSRSALLQLSRGVGWTRWPVTFTAVSQVAAAPLRALGLEIAVLPNGVDVEWWRPEQPASPRRPDGDVTLVSVMRLARRKRPAALATILDRVRELVSTDVRLRAVVVGDGPQRAELERHLRRSRATDWVELTGTLPPNRIRDVLHDADLYLAPAVLESFGIAALEARCAGLPLVAMASGGVGEFVRDGVDGVLVGSDDDMAAAAARMIRSRQLRAMQRHNRSVAPSEMAWPQAVARTVRCYEQAAARPAGATLPLPV